MRILLPGDIRPLNWRDKGIWGLMRLGLCLVLSAVFIWAGVAKLADVHGFARTIEGFGMVPESLLALVAISLPVLELIAGVGLLLGLRGSLSAIAGMLLMFLVVLGIAISQEYQGDCGCFSAEEIAEQGAAKAAFVRDLFLMAACMILFAMNHVKNVIASREEMKCPN